MKKLICLVLSLMVLLTAMPVLAVEYTLPEKLQRQIDFGNGVRGTLSVNVTGDAEWVKTLDPLNGVEFQIRSITTDGRFQHKFYTLQGEEEQIGLTQLYGDEENIYLSSALLPDTLLTMTTGGDLLDQLAGDEMANPTWYSAALNIMNVPETTWAGKWLPALESYAGVNSAIEIWLNDYASEPSIVKNAAGASVMLVRYDIPLDALKEQVKVMLQKLFQDETLMTLLRAQLTEEQVAIYLNPSLTDYYSQVIDALPVTGTVIMEREMTTMGEINRTVIQLPLPENEGGWTMLVMDEADGMNTFTLQGQDTLTLKVEQTITTAESDTYLGHVYVTPGDQESKALAAAFTVVRIHSISEDADSRSHDITTWDIDLKSDLPEGADATAYTVFEPIDVNLRVHYHSKNANYSPTTMSIDAAAKFADAQVAVLYEIQTRSPWELDNLPTEGAKNIADMTTDEVTQVMTDLALNGLVTLMSMQPEELPVPEEQEETATATDLVEAAEPVEEQATATDLEPATATDLATGTDLSSEPTAVPALPTQP